MKRIAKEIFSYIIIFVVVLGATKLINDYVATSVKIDGQSMSQTLHHDERMWMFRLPEVKRFDIVVFPSPTNQRLYVKRIIGVPGDEIVYENGQLILNGHPLEEPYLEPMNSDYEGNFTADFKLEDVAGSAIVPEGKFFVMGDNRRNSVDGRSFGFIDSDSVLGKTDFVYWPLSQWRIMDKYKVSQDGTAIIVE